MFEVQSVEENYWKIVSDIIHADETKFEVDQAIVWTRESKGKVVKKHGTIAAIVAPDRVPNKEDFPSLYGRHPESPNDIGKPRKGYSYVVRWKDGSISWPLAQYLSPTYVSDAVDESVEVTKKDTVGKPLVEVFAEEENPHKGSTLDSFLEEEKRISTMSPFLNEALDKVEEVSETFSEKLSPEGYPIPTEWNVSEASFPIKDDGIEDVETQVERELEEVTTQEPPWNNPSSRMFMHQDGHDGDGHQDIKTDSDPDRELGHHMRGVIRIISEALFGKRNNVTRDTYIKGLEESIKSQDVWRTEIEQWKSKAQHYADELLATAIREHNINNENARLKERIQKEMSFQTQISTQADAEVDKLQKEIEVLCKENESLTDENGDLRLARQTAIEDIEHWKLEFNRVLDQREKLQDVLNLYQSSDNLVTDETKLVDTYKDQIEHYKSVCLDLNNQIENLESHAEKREEQIVSELEKIEKLEAEVKDFKTKNEILPDEAVKHLRSEVVRLQGELDTAKSTIEHYKNQAVKPKAGRKVTSDEETIKDAVRFSMNRVYRAMDDQYNVSDRQLEAMYGEWKDAQK